MYSPRENWTLQPGVPARVYYTIVSIVRVFYNVYSCADHYNRNNNIIVNSYILLSRAIYPHNNIVYYTLRSIGTRDAEIRLSRRTSRRIIIIIITINNNNIVIGVYNNNAVDVRRFREACCTRASLSLSH